MIVSLWFVVDQLVLKMKKKIKTDTKKIVKHFDFISKEEIAYKSTKEAAEVYEISPVLIRVYANSTLQFIAGNRNVPKYFKTATFYYDSSLGKTKTNERLWSRYTHLPFDCKICHLKFGSSKALASHLQFAHKTSSREYTIKHLYLGRSPSCNRKDCDETPRYVSFSFREFCKNHSYEAMKIGGANGGKFTAWNKGKSKFNDERILKQSIAVLGEKNHFYGKNHNKKSIKKISQQKSLSIKEVIKRLSSFEDCYEFSYNPEKYKKRSEYVVKTKCKKCGFEQNKKLSNIERGSKCKKCFPFTVSKGELEIGDYIQSLFSGKIVRNDRVVIRPYELDVYISDINLAFEYHGIYWHMDRGQENFNKKLHLEKQQLCQEKNIQLIQIFSNQWSEKQEIVKSIISRKIKTTKIEIDIRETYVDLIDAEKGKEFFEQNHLYGSVESFLYIGLKNKKTKELLFVVSIKKLSPESIEISRLASAINTNIDEDEAFAKILSYIKQYAIRNEFTSIISYVDLLVDNGKIYENTGFNFVKHTGLNYWYTDGTMFYEQPTSNLVQKNSRLLEEGNVYKIYGAGNLIYEIKL